MIPRVLADFNTILTSYTRVPWQDLRELSGVILSYYGTKYKTPKR